MAPNTKATKYQREEAQLKIEFSILPYPQTILTKALVNPPKITAKRYVNNPLVTFDTHPSLGENINGPSLIKIPDWVPNPLGQYYLYFGHHGGQHIRLAYADQVEGPWNIYEPGVIPLSQATAFQHHLASPDVHLDENLQEIFMFLHGPAKNGEDGQMTVLARSKDGIHFKVDDTLLGRSYFKAFLFGDYWYAIANTGDFYRTKDISIPWEKMDRPLLGPWTVEDSFGKRDSVRIRHSAMLVKGDQLYLFFTRKGDAPEQVLCVQIQLTDDWNTWEFSEIVEVLRPERDWEGAQYELKPSKLGTAVAVQQLRDPAIYHEGNQIFMFYSFGGEEGLALAELFIENMNV